MKQTVQLTREQLGDAIVGYVGQKFAGATFFPFHISESSWKPEYPVRVTVQYDPESDILKTESDQAILDKGGSYFEVRLTKAEIIEAIWLKSVLVSMQKFAKPEPGDISIEIPEEASFTISYVPRGSKLGEYEHALL